MYRGKRHSGRLEIHWMSKIQNHPHIAEYIGHSEHEENPCLITRYAGEDLKEIELCLIEDQLFNVIEQMAMGVDELHSEKMIHRDIHLANFAFLGETNEVRLLDLCYATPFGAILDKHTGQSTLYPSEYFTDGKANAQIDIYMFGLCLLQLLCRVYTTGSANSREVKREKNRRLKLLHDKMGEHIFLLVIEKCLLHRDERYCSMKEILFDVRNWRQTHPESTHQVEMKHKFEEDQNFPLRIFHWQTNIPKIYLHYQQVITLKSQCKNSTWTRSKNRRIWKLPVTFLKIFLSHSLSFL
eukprot:TRINITY_DN3256_c0_g1_i2.p1 TRINITY_DN3256_c0_g1~~TRINITY_DN3256_c0_g1_i2.p1  ORF type:complete len:347 (+),score=78.34 TRINITY_DN3256_c0_g1_i2:153-1043(+)